MKNTSLLPTGLSLAASGLSARSLLFQSFDNTVDQREITDAGKV